MKVALVHDYIGEYGGAERVLEVLCEMFPDAPIYTAYAKKSSKAYAHFKSHKIYESWAAVIPFFPKLASPLRFLTPLIWGSLDLSKYDLVISSASWYITKGFNKKNFFFFNQKGNLPLAGFLESFSSFFLASMTKDSEVIFSNFAAKTIN